MMNKFRGGPVGLDTLAAALGEDSGTLEEVYEPYLIKNGFIQRTPRGRVVTELAEGSLRFAVRHNRDNACLKDLVRQRSG